VTTHGSAESDVRWAYGNGKQEFRGYDGAQQVPENLSDSVQAVLGLDNRPVARPIHAG
jgi:hypothetical protein